MITHRSFSSIFQSWNVSKELFLLMMWETHLHCSKLLNGLCSVFLRQDCCLSLLGFFWFCLWLCFFQIHSYLIQIKYANCISKSPRETPCNSDTANNKQHSSLHSIFWMVVALTDADGLLHRSTYYRSNRIISSTVYLVFVSHFLSKITKKSLEISGDLPKPVSLLLTSCSNLCGQLLKECPC